MVSIALGASISGTIGGNPAGTTYNLAAGTYYGQNFLPQTGDTIIGDPNTGTVLSGACVITSWTGAGSAWKATTGATDTSGFLSGTALLSTFGGTYNGVGTATFSTNTMNVTGVTSGTFTAGSVLYVTGVTQGVYIVSGPGGTGTYTLSATVGTLGSRAVKASWDTAGSTSTNPLAPFDNDLFVDGVLYTRVAKPGPATAGTWWWDESDSSVNVSTNLTGHLVELSMLSNLGFDNNNPNVTYRDVIIEKYANNASSGAIQGQPANYIGVTFRHNHGIGLTFPSQNYRGYYAKNCLFYHNGQLGCGGPATDFLLENSEISFNNYAGFTIDWEAGGMKNSNSINFTIRNCHVHDNTGIGLWWDGDSTDTTVQGNRVENNTSVGISYEISHGRSRFSGNRVLNNGGVGILISNSNGVEIDNNVIVCNSANTRLQDGCVWAINDNRAPNLTNFLNVHDNLMISTATGPAVGGIQVVLAITAPTWTWDNNSYVLTDTTGTHWVFDLPTGVGSPNNVTLAAAQTLGYETGARTSVVVGTSPVNLQAMLNSIRPGQAADAITELVVQALILSLYSTLRVPV